MTMNKWANEQWEKEWDLAKAFFDEVNSKDCNLSKASRLKDKWLKHFYDTLNDSRHLAIISLAKTSSKDRGRLDSLLKTTHNKD